MSNFFKTQIIICSFVLISGCAGLTEFASELEKLANEVNKSITTAGSVTGAGNSAEGLRYFDLGEIEFDPDTGVEEYGNHIPGRYDFEYGGSIYENDDDIYVIYKNSGKVYAKGFKTKKTLELTGRSDISSRKIAKSNGLIPVSLTKSNEDEERKIVREKCRKLAKKEKAYITALRKCNVNHAGRHGASFKHKYYFRVHHENYDNRLEYIDYSNFVNNRDVNLDEIYRIIQGWKYLPNHRGSNTFGGYMKAYDISHSKDDLVQASYLAQSPEQETIVQNIEAQIAQYEEEQTIKTIVKSQTILKYGGYYALYVDGNFGPGSRASVKKFQNDYDLETTGVLDEETINALNIFEKEWEKQSNWELIGENALYSTINGNSLISSHQLFCKNQKSLIPCTKIAILSRNTTNRIPTRALVTIIDSDQKRISKNDWGIRASSNGISSAFHIGILELHRLTGGFLLRGGRNHLRNLVSINDRKNTLRVETRIQGEYLYIDIVEGGSKNFIAQANAGNYSNINNRGKLTGMQVLTQKTLTALGKGVLAQLSENSSTGTVESEPDSSIADPIPNPSAKNRSVESISYKYLRDDGGKSYSVKCSDGENRDLVNNSDGGWEECSYWCTPFGAKNNMSLEDAAVHLCESY